MRRPYDAMSYTTVSNVSGMYPTFARGGASQKPSDALIQTFIDDVAGEIDAVLQRRFTEAIGTLTFAAWVAALPTDAVNILEKINRYGAAAQLGATLASFGVSGARDLAKSYSAEYERQLNDLNARLADGKPATAGPYDHLFDSLARTETPRPAMKGSVAGGDQPATQTSADMGQSNVFGKFDKRGT